jgi:hypothetical protein
MEPCLPARPARDNGVVLGSNFQDPRHDFEECGSRSAVQLCSLLGSCLTDVLELYCMSLTKGSTRQP